MIMIVLYHCYCYNAGIWGAFEDHPITYSPEEVAIIRNFAYMALNSFVFISGLLYCRIGTTGKYNNIRRFLKGKVERLLLPYFIWGMLLCIVLNNRYELQDLLYGISHLWFLLMLFGVFTICELTYKAWRDFNLKKSFILFISLLIFDVVTSKYDFIFNNGTGKSIFCLKLIFDYVPIFYLGIITEKHGIVSIVRRKFINCFSPILITLCFIAGSSFYLIHVPVSKSLQWIPFYIFIMLTYSWLKDQNYKLRGGDLQNVIQILDKYSLSIYIIHHIIIIAFYTYVPENQLYMTDHYIVAPIFMFMIVMPLSIIIASGIKMLPYSKYIIGA